MPSGWVRAPLRQVATTQLGRMLSANRETGVHPKPYLRNRDVQWGHINVDELPVMDFGPHDAARYLLRLDDVLVCEGGEVGRAAIWNDQLGECYYQKALHRVRTSAALLPGFLLYLLEHYARTRAFERYTSGSTIAHLPQEDLRNLPIPIPPVAEQDRIVAAIEEQLSRLDSGVAALKRICQNLKRMRSAALSGLLRAEDGTDFPQVALGDVLAHGRYGTSTKCSVDGKGLPVLRIPNVQSGRLALSNLKYAIDLSVDLGASRVAEGDILIIRTNGSRSLIGRVAVVPQIPYPVAFASYLIQLRMDPVTVNPAYVVAALAAPRMRAQIEELAATTAGQYNISLDKLRSLRIPLPSLPQQAQALSTAENLLSIANHIDEEVALSLKRANQLRSSILASAFSGRLVPQDSTDEPSSGLLERIAAERASSNGKSPAHTRKPVMREEVTA
jgi:type I restriction enzyme S subunit